MADLLIWLCIGLAAGFAFRAWQHWRDVAGAPLELEPIEPPKWDALSPVITGQGVQRYKMRTRADIARAVLARMTSRFRR